MGRQFLLMWPRTHRVFGPKAHARVCCRTFGAAGETTECYGSGVSVFCGTTRTYNGAICVDWHSMVENKHWNEVVCHVNDLPGFSHDHRS